MSSEVYLVTESHMDSSISRRVPSGKRTMMAGFPLQNSLTSPDVPVRDLPYTEHVRRPSAEYSLSKASSSFSLPANCAMWDISIVCQLILNILQRYFLAS